MSLLLSIVVRNLGSLDSNINCISSEQLVVFIIYKKKKKKKKKYIKKKIAGKSKSERKIRLIYTKSWKKEICIIYKHSINNAAISLSKRYVTKSPSHSLYLSLIYELIIIQNTQFCLYFPTTTINEIHQ